MVFSDVASLSSLGKVYALGVWFSATNQDIVYLVSSSFVLEMKVHTKVLARTGTMVKLKLWQINISPGPELMIN